MIPFPAGYQARNNSRCIKSFEDGARFAIIVDTPRKAKELWHFDSATLNVTEKLPLTATGYVMFHLLKPLERSQYKPPKETEISFCLNEQMENQFESVVRHHSQQLQEGLSAGHYPMMES